MTRTVTINGITYSTRASSNARLIDIPVEGQTPLAESQESIDARSYNLSTRNGANAYIIRTEAEKLYLNFIAQKVSVTDQAINEVLQPQFEYFTVDVIPEVEGFTLPDGIIVRVASANSTPKPKEDYDYCIMMNGALRAIPNYKTLEVMLAERNQTLLSVRVIEQNQFDELPKEKGSTIPDKTSAWTEDYADITSIEAFRELENNAKAASAIAADASANAAAQIGAVQAQAAADAAAADAAQAQAQAAQAASQAAIAQAAAAQAAAEAAQAEAEAQIAANS